MYLFGFSINILTLLGIVLATGLVVDDAIVVLENIYVKIEEGKDPIEAGHEGASEIYFAIISTTITLAAVFLPIIFLQGLTGRLFREFGVVVAGSVLISAFVSLTLTPDDECPFPEEEKEAEQVFRRHRAAVRTHDERLQPGLTWFVRHRGVRRGRDGGVDGPDLPGGFAAQVGAGPARRQEPPPDCRHGAGRAPRTK
jgi:multidrug efflux pump subunit AcrB